MLPGNSGNAPSYYKHVDNLKKLVQKNRKFNMANCRTKADLVSNSAMTGPHYFPEKRSIKGEKRHLHLLFIRF